ncbi:MMPL family transporter [Streptomyces sp. NPDC012421]|uniref:MMPL family transporter n=1 Tax=Streptomyces sp. NPDC012421 TaxID=3364832 RepID=UPI0036F0FCA9
MSWRFHRAGPLGVLVLWLVLSVAAGPYTVRLGELAKAGQEVQLPVEAESARVARLLNPAGQEEPLPLAVIWASRAKDEQIIADQQEAVRRVTTRLAGPAAVPIVSTDGRALTVVMAVGPAGLPSELAAARKAAGAVEGTRVHLAGPAAAQADLDGAFAQIDSTLLAVALGGVLMILLLVYRSVLMPLLVIAGALLALATACAVLYLLARSGRLPIDGQAQGIVFVLVIGASTDYAFLLVARHREELTGQPDAVRAMASACRATAPPALASAATIACAMMTLTFSDLPAEQALGPAVAIAMVCCAAVSLTFLPAVLVLCGPRTAGPSAGAKTEGGWTKLARVIGRRPRRVWLGSLVLLAAGAACAPFPAQTGVPLHQALPAGSSSSAGHDILARHFPSGTASPLVVLVPSARAADVRDRIATTPGVATVTTASPGPEGRAQILATSTDTPDSARDTVDRVRTTLVGTGRSWAVRAPSSPTCTMPPCAATDWSCRWCWSWSWLS